MLLEISSIVKLNFLLIAAPRATVLWIRRSAERVAAKIMKKRKKIFFLSLDGSRAKSGRQGKAPWQGRGHLKAAVRLEFFPPEQPARSVINFHSFV
jgi:hypothetical protein